MHVPYSLRPIYCTRYQRIGTVTNRPTPGFLAIQQHRLKLFGHIARAVPSEDHSRALRASSDRLPVDWRRPRPVSPGFEQSTEISNHSTLDFTLHYGEHRIVLPGDASWKRLCPSSVPPDDDDDDDETASAFADCWSRESYRLDTLLPIVY